MQPRPDVDVVAMSGVTLQRGGRRILGPLDWNVGDGQRWVVMGPNGSGKTSLVRIAALAIHPSSGTIDVLGRRLGRTDVRALRRDIGFVCPTLIGSVRPSLTAAEFVMAALRGALDVIWHRYDAADRLAASAALDRAGVRHRHDDHLATLSSGELQRVQMARALLVAPRLLILDEPSAGLDIGGREDLVDLIDHRLDPDLPIILVTHHVEEIPAGFSHWLAIREGTVVASGPIDDTLDSESLSEAFGVSLRVRRRKGRWSASLG